MLSCIHPLKKIHHIQGLKFTPNVYVEIAPPTFNFISCEMLNC